MLPGKITGSVTTAWCGLRAGTDILRGIDRWQLETYHGGPVQGINGMLLIERLTRSYVHNRQQAPGFIQEMRIASDLVLLTFDVAPGLANVGPASADPSVGLLRGS